MNKKKYTTPTVSVLKGVTAMFIAVSDPLSSFTTPDSDLVYGGQSSPGNGNAFSKKSKTTNYTDPWITIKERETIQ